MSPNSPEGGIVDETLPTPITPADENINDGNIHAEDQVEQQDGTATPPAEVNLEKLISDLRASLASSQTLLSTQATRLSTLTDLETELSQLKDQYAFLAAAKDAVEKQLKDETKRREMAEESVELLRGQVEQARRGVGMLQKQEQERKRLSFLPAGTAALGLSTEAEEVLAEKEAPTSKASKRTSILVGRGHRRASSQSEPGDGLVVSALRDQVGTLTSPNLSAPRTGGLRELRLGSGTGPVSGVTTSPQAHQSTFFDDSTPLPVPPPMNKRQSSQSIPVSTPLTESPSRGEEMALRQELALARTKLAESEEAREASEACLKALREFMAGNTGGEGGTADDELLKNIRLPPLPTDKDPDEVAGLQAKKPTTGASTGGWGFKLWKQGPTSPALSTAVEPPGTPLERLSPPASVRNAGAPAETPRMSPLPTPGELPSEGAIGAVPASSTPLGNFVSGWTKGVQPGTPAGDVKPAAPARSLSSFFSRKKEDAAKEKELPPRPKEEVLPEVIELADDVPLQTSSGDVAQGAENENVVGEDGLAPSPSIPDRPIGDAESLKEVPLKAEAEEGKAEGEAKKD